jgi:hypothetical protein
MEGIAVLLLICAVGAWWRSEQESALGRSSRRCAKFPWQYRISKTSDSVRGRGAFGEGRARAALTSRD